MRLVDVRWVALGLVLVLVGSIPAFAQNLAEAARREKERQKQYQTAKVRSYTREDLERLREKARVSTVGPTAPPTPSAPAETPAEKPAPPPEKPPVATDVEKEVRQKQAEIEKLRAELANLETQMNPSMALYRATDFGSLARRKRELEERIQALEKEIQDLREKARAPAGPH